MKAHASKIASFLVASLALAGVAAAQSDAAWKEFSSPEGRFSVLLPGTPQQQSQTQPIAGGSIATNLYIVNVGTGFYGVTVGDYPKEIIAKKAADVHLNDTRDGLLRQVKGELLSEQPISSQGFPGREIKISASRGGKNLVAYDRMFLVDDRLFQALVVVETKDDNSRDIRKFLDSFRFVK